MATFPLKTLGQEIQVHFRIDFTIFANSSIFPGYLQQQGSSLSESNKPLQFDVQSSVSDHEVLDPGI